jgi:iron(III) transport system ATP-binding protein
MPSPAADAVMAGVQLLGVAKRYGAVTAVADIDIDIAEGEFIVLLGPSGCGKTTTLRCIAGLEDISDGEIRIDGALVSGRGVSVPPERREIGMVFQSYAIWPHMTVAENVAFGLKLKKLPKTEIAARVDRALETVGLHTLHGRGASELSGGQQQRVAVARAIVLEPRVLLFDEPLSNLDARLRDHMRLELRQLHRRLGITSIYVTHDQQEAMAIADRIILMNAGRIDQTGSPDDLYRRPRTRFGAEFIGLANIMEARVVGGDERSTRIVLESGVELRAATGRPAGERVDVVCRPENVVIAVDEIAGPNVLAASVTTTVSLGSLSDVFLQAGDVPIRAQVSPPRPIAEGQRVWVQLPPEALRLLPRRDEPR